MKEPKPKHLVVGYKGEVGSAIYKVLKKSYKAVDGVDINFSTITNNTYDVIHFCIPYNRKFVKVVRHYKKLESVNTLLIIHSTVPPGISDKCHAVHSPVRGVHPKLYDGIITFVKYFGGNRSEEAAKIFRKCGIKTKTTPKAKTTEIGKILDTTAYGINILIEKEYKRICDKYKVDFDVAYTNMNKTYNEGYLKLKMPQFQKYVLKHIEGPIGGHCIVPNARLLDSWMTKLLRKK